MPTAANTNEPQIDYWHRRGWLTTELAKVAYMFRAAVSEAPRPAIRSVDATQPVVSSSRAKDALWAAEAHVDKQRSQPKVSLAHLERYVDAECWPIVYGAFIENKPIDALTELVKGSGRHRHETVKFAACVGLRQLKEIVVKAAIAA